MCERERECVCVCETSLYWLVQGTQSDVTLGTELVHNLERL